MVEAEPPRMASILLIDRSARRKDIGSGKSDIAELQYRQSVFLKLKVFRTTGRNRNASYSDIGITITTGSF
jgi:hypothetical protein